MSLDIDFYYNRGSVTREINSVIYLDEAGTECRIYKQELPKYFSEEQLKNLSFEQDIIENVFETNITHNLTAMAKAAEIYNVLWRPYRLLKDFPTCELSYHEELKLEQNTLIKAEELIPYLEKGYNLLNESPEYFKQYEASNGWGTYNQFVSFVRDVLYAAKQYPDAIVSCSR